MSVPTGCRVVVFDMDGVLWAMDDPIPHAAEAVARCRAQVDRVFFLTNNSSKTRQEYVDKLERFRISATLADVVTSANATAQLIAREGADGKRAVIIGEQGLSDELTSVGVAVTRYEEGDLVDYVIVGWDRGLTYDKLAQAHAAVVRGGARFIATNRDTTYPGPGGRTMPGGGSIVAALAASTGVEPQTVGKPEPFTLNLILEASGASPDECLVIGDRLDTDIAIGARVGAQTALVLTGVSTASEAHALPAAEQPTFVWPDLSFL